MSSDIHETDWLVRNGSLPGEGAHLLLTPERAGWKYVGLRVYMLGAGAELELELEGVEAAVVPLAAEGVEVEVTHGAREGLLERRTLKGRAGVFAGMTDLLYVPVGHRLRMRLPGGGEVAVATARAEREFPVQYLAADAYHSGVRGSGPATRQINTLGGPEGLQADRLVLCEALTPDGNWSSYPPHRHDGIGSCAWHNEELYYFKIGRRNPDGSSSPHGSPHGFGYHSTYTADEDPGPRVDANVRVSDGDLFLVPRGFHGPCVAAPCYPMYYLNVLAGPGPHRTLNFCDDPLHTWIRPEFENMLPDPRCPMTRP